METIDAEFDGQKSRIKSCVSVAHNILNGEACHVYSINRPIREIISVTSSMLSQFLKEIGPRDFGILDLRKSILLNLSHGDETQLKVTCFNRKFSCRFVFHIPPRPSRSELQFRIIHFYGSQKNAAKGGTFIGLEMLIIDEQDSVLSPNSCSIHIQISKHCGLKGDLYDVVGQVKVVNGQSLIDCPIFDENYEKIQTVDEVRYLMFLPTSRIQKRMTSVKKLWHYIHENV
ncbi:hypothetical protein YC2023_011558 [Brassica napus]